MEVMIAALLFMVAVQAAVDVSRPSSEQQSLNQLRTLGNDSLLALDNKPCEDSIYYNSSLIKYTMTNDITNLTSFFNTTLPNTVSYSIYITKNENSSEIFSMGQSIGDTMVSHYLIYHLGEIFEVQLQMWYEPRG